LSEFGIRNGSLIFYTDWGALIWRTIID
jgi:hypothetical protein